MNTNLKVVVKQLSKARHDGRISVIVQMRVLRRLKHPALIKKAEQEKQYWMSLLSPEVQARFNELQEIRQQVHREIVPILHEREEAKRNMERKGHVKHIPLVGDYTKSLRVAAPPLVGYEFTPEWWDSHRCYSKED